MRCWDLGVTKRSLSVSSGNSPGKGVDIRNFSIIAHIDHGKSTLADRLLERTGAVVSVEHAQFLDSMELEQERGITIKAKAVRMMWRDHVLNLLDTPGHVDFTFELHRALWASEGVLLVVDASQGIQAQTVANCEIARREGLTIVPVINKIDLANARVEEAQEQILLVLGIEEEPYKISAKTGLGIEALLDGIVSGVKPPSGSDPSAPPAALLFDSYMDSFRGVVLVVRVFEGVLKPGDRVRFFHDPVKEYVVEELGYLTPNRCAAVELRWGEVGYIICGIKDPRQIRHGETLIAYHPVMGAPAPELLKLRGAPLRPLGAPLKPFVYVGFYPIQLGEVGELSRALEKLHLTDPSFEYTPEHSAALGPGFRAGFLGLLHLEIIQQRLKREYGQEVIITNPNVRYRVHTKREGILEVVNPAHFPSHGEALKVEEPYVKVKIFTPVDYMGAILELLKSRRGVHLDIEHTTPTMIRIIWEIPLAEMVVDFYDKLKSISQGYASLDYELGLYRANEPLSKVEILVQGDPCDALSFVCPKERAFYESRDLLERLREIVPRQLFEVNLQAQCDGRIIAKERIAPLRKDVIAKCYGGDISRKMKLLKKQKEGKRRMRMVGKVEIPPEAFLTVVRKT
ncbi:MAG: elongation factor 4 [Elusimicrobia bacterium]|nr:elongation factor 4 [Elusimicrobiota bacterium]